MSSSGEGPKVKVAILEARCNGSIDGQREIVVTVPVEMAADPQIGLIVGVVKSGIKDSSIETTGKTAEKAPAIRDSNHDAGKCGPAQVNSNAYKENWERVFGPDKRFLN